MSTAARFVFWSRTKTLTLCLLAAWLLVNLAVPWFARDLGDVLVLGFPLGFWLTAEGSLLIYLVLIVVYVVAMDRLELAYLKDLEAAAPDPDAGLK
jgi:putative solute:sodium symporter small subunit